MDIPRIWRLSRHRYRLEGTTCNNCSGLTFPPAIVCSECKSRDLSQFIFSGKGTIYSFSTVYNPLTQFAEYVPYIVALIDLEEGPRVAAQLTDVIPSDVEIGMPVEMVIRKISEQGKKGIIIYGYKFRPPIIIE